MKQNFGALQGHVLLLHVALIARMVVLLPNSRRMKLAHNRTHPDRTKELQLRQVKINDLRHQKTPSFSK